MRIKFFKNFPEIQPLTLLLPVFILFIKKASCVEESNSNIIIRTQVKNFLLENLPKCKSYDAESDKINPEGDVVLLHVFKGLSLFNDHFRFGGILDYCREQGMITERFIPQEFEYNVNRELLMNVKLYVECVELIYNVILNVPTHATSSINVKASERFRRFMKAFLLTKPVFLAVELNKLIALEEDDLRFNRCMEIIATLSIEELRLIRQIISVLNGGKELDTRDILSDVPAIGYNMFNIYHFVNERFYFGTENQPDSFKIETDPSLFLQRFIIFENEEQLIPECKKKSEEIPTMNLYQIMSERKSIAMHYMLFKAVCSVISLEDLYNHQQSQQQVNDWIIKEEIATYNLILATMLSFHVNEIDTRFQYTHIPKNAINGIFQKRIIGQSLKSVLSRSFEAGSIKIFLLFNVSLNIRVMISVTKTYFTDFDQIDFRGLPQYKGGSFDALGFFQRFYTWVEVMCKGGRGARIGKEGLCGNWGDGLSNNYIRLIKINTNEEYTYLFLASLYRYANIHGGEFMNNLISFIKQLKDYKKDNYFVVTDNQINFAKKNLFSQFLGKINDSFFARFRAQNYEIETKVEQLTDPIDQLNIFYSLISDKEISVSAIFEKNRQVNMKGRNAELGRMAMVNYTIHGLAYLLHVVWPISYHLILEKQCKNFVFTDLDEEYKIDQKDIKDGGDGFAEIIQNESWLEKVIRRGRKIAIKRKNEFKKYLIKRQQIGRGESSSAGKRKEKEREISFFTDNWIWFYLALRKNEFDSNLAELMPGQQAAETPGMTSPFGTTPVQQSPLHFTEISGATSSYGQTTGITPGGTPRSNPQRTQLGFQAVQQSQAGDDSDDEPKQPKCFACFSSKSKRGHGRRNKRSTVKIFLGNHKRQKRMVGTPPRHTELNTIFCGRWLAPMWFGINFMLFIIGWMLLALQYYPMFD